LNKIKKEEDLAKDLLLKATAELDQSQADQT
jgi:hypothetical protein